MLKSIKVQLKPNNKQNTMLFERAGVARWAYNWTLARQKENYEAGGKFISNFDLRKELTQLKKTEGLKWLNKYSNNITKQAIIDACEAYIKFFKKLAAFPRFKSRRKTKPAFYHDNVKLKFTQTHVQLEKFGKVKLAEFGRIPTSGKYGNPRVTFDGLSWWISVVVDFPDDQSLVSKPTSAPIGIDLGLKSLAVVSTGVVYKNINKTKSVRKANRRLVRLQRQASKSYEKLKNKEIKRKGKNLLKLEKQISKTYKRLTNLRANYIHQITTELVKTKPAYIVVEDLNVKGMLSNRHLAKAVANQKLYEFRQQLSYKSSWYKIPLIVADKWFPSSKLCSCCGFIKRDLKLSDRTYKCDCGNEMDRDLQAAINLREYPRLVKLT